MESSSTVCRSNLRASSRIKTVYLRSLAIILLCMLKWTHAQSSLSEADIQELVDAHNLFRSMVEPQASNIQRVEWNTELAGVAQAYAEMCIFRDNPDRADQAPSFPTVGENLSASNTRTPNYTEFVERGWFSQRVNYNYDTNMCSSPGSCTDYIQLVWASVTQVGCGVARCPEIEGFGLPDSVILVCNYAPEGNIEDGRPYISGDVCSSCPEGTVCVENICTQTTTSPPITTVETTSPPPTTNPPITTVEATSPPPTTNPPITTVETTSPPPTTNPPVTTVATTSPPPLTPTMTEAPTTETVSTDVTTCDQQETVTTQVMPDTTTPIEIPTDTTVMETTTEVTTVATTVAVTTTNRPTMRPKPTKDPCAIYKWIILKLKWQLRWRKYYSGTVPLPDRVPMTDGSTSETSNQSSSESSRSSSRSKSSRSRKHKSRASRSRTSRSRTSRKSKSRSRKRG